MISNKTDFLVLATRNNDMNSPCLHNHGCVISINCKIIANGYNIYNVFSYRIFGNNVCSYHAEVNAFAQLFCRINKQSYEKKFKKYIYLCSQNKQC